MYQGKDISVCTVWLGKDQRTFYIILSFNVLVFFIEYLTRKQQAQNNRSTAK